MDAQRDKSGTGPQDEQGMQRLPKMTISNTFLDVQSTEPCTKHGKCKTFCRSLHCIICLMTRNKFADYLEFVRLFI
jgi:hypothetical protein